MTTGSPVVPKFATWSAADHPMVIEYAPVVLDEIRMTAVEGYHRVPHGGVETGGVLFGARSKTGVRIKAWRPIECEYAKGPSFQLSERDEAGLAELLSSWSSDPELAAMEPVGWYRAHTRSEILLSGSDVTFYERYFPQPWQVALIVKPASFAPTRAGFFFREPDGTLRTQSSYREFVMTPLGAGAGRRPEPRPDPEPAPAPAPAPVEAAAIPLATPPPREPAPSPPQAEPAAPREVVPMPPLASRASGIPWLPIGVAAALILGVLGFWLLRPPHNSLAISTTEAAGRLKIAWDRDARPVERARAAYIDIDDGGVKTQLSLTPTDLRLGNVSYVRKSADVAVTMTLDVPGSTPVVEMTRFLGASQPAASTVPAPSAANSRPLAPAKKAMQVPTGPSPAQKLPVQTARVEPPQTPTQPPAQPARRVVPFQPPAARKPASPTTVAVAPPPSLDNLPATAQAPPLNSVVGSVSAPPPPATPAPAAPRSNPVARPASGRIIWTGRFPKNGKLVVEGNRASFGSMSGALPPGPARVTAYPGDLTPAGITVFSGDRRYASPVTEPARADNGWNATTFTWDARRAAGVHVLEQPTPQNGYRLVLQSDSTKPSVLVLEWRAAQ